MVHGDDYYNGDSNCDGDSNGNVNGNGNGDNDCDGVCNSDDSDTCQWQSLLP